MAKIGIFNTAPRKWFPYDADTEVELEFINKDRMAKIIARADSAAKKVAGTPSLVYDMFLGKAAIHGWRHSDQGKNPGHPGLLFPDGRTIGFNEENRNLLMKSCSEFSTFVFRNCTESSNFLDESMVVDDQKTLDELVNESDLENTEGKND